MSKLIFLSNFISEISEVDTYIIEYTEYDPRTNNCYVEIRNGIIQEANPLDKALGVLLG